MTAYVYRVACGPCAWSVLRRNALQAGLAAGRHLEVEPEHRTTIGRERRREKFAVQIAAGPRDDGRLIGEPVDLILLESTSHLEPLADYVDRHVAEGRSVFLFDLDDPAGTPTRLGGEIGLQRELPI